MQGRNAKFRPVHENLDTAYVNLAALLRYLQQRDFVGLVHVKLDEYDANVFLNAKNTPHVREKDHAAGREAEGEAALQRLLVRANMAGGLINVYERVEEAAGNAAPSSNAKGVEKSVTLKEIDAGAPPGGADWNDLLRLSGDLIAAVERAALSFGADFNALFRAARLELAEDFPFLDPMTKRFEYAYSDVRLHVQSSASAYISGISECLRRVVDKLAAGPRELSIRERVALELAVMARRRQADLKRFNLVSLIDRIAGTRVL